MNVSQEDARTLAVAYSAYNDLTQRSDMTPLQWNSVYVWGKMLAKAQLATGIILAPDVAAMIPLAEVNSRGLYD